jgi:tetratricopeptide (TPR) repeat protein
MRVLLSAIAMLLAVAACNNNKATEKDVNAVLSEEDQLKNAIKIYPDSMLLRDKLITLYADKENYEAAIATVNQVLAKDSTIAYFWDIKANLHGFNDDTINAIRSLERAADLDPQPKYLLSLGYLYADTRNEKAVIIGDALIYAHKAAAKKEALLIKGIYYRNTGNSQKAIGLFDEALAIDYTFTFAYREKAITQYNGGKYAEGIKTLERGTTLQNSFDEGYYWMGRCYEKLGKTAEAIENYKKAILYAPGQDYAEAGDALSRLGVK